MNLTIYSIQTFRVLCPIKSFTIRLPEIENMRQTIPAATLLPSLGRSLQPMLSIPDGNSGHCGARIKYNRSFR